MPPDISRFQSIYDAVTLDLREYLREEHTATPSRLSADEAEWFDFLIVTFQSEYRRWERSTHPDIIKYLQTAESCNRDLKLAAHVFLHVAYDLPRIIQCSFSRFPGMETRGRGVFVRPGPRFLRVFQDQMRDGTFGVVGRLVGQLDAARALGYWLIALRSVAWIHAEMLDDLSRHSPYEFARVPSRMIAALTAALEGAKKKSWVLGIERMNNPSLSAGVPLLGAVMTWEQIAGGAIGAGIVAAGAFGFQRHLVTSSIDVFGALTHRGMVRAIDPQRFESEGRVPEPA